MKRKIFTLGLLGLGLSVNAQATFSLTDQASVHIKEDALVYSGGEVKTKASGVVDNFGNVMIVGGGLKTLTATNTNKTDGGNFILRFWSSATNSGDIVNGGTNTKYGQLYINGTNQSDVTGIVDKEFKDNHHGTYQQIAIPFHNKKFSELSTELGGGFTNNRWTQTEILAWDNPKVRFNKVLTSDQTTVATSYYALGAKNFNAFSPASPITSSTGTGVYVVKGVPYTNGHTASLSGAGVGIDFGPNGSYRNYFREIYNSYIQDNWDVATPWSGNFGKNIYQLGNPYLTNLDLGQLGSVVSNLRGVRVEPAAVSTRTNGSTYDLTTAKFISYNTSGVAIGDVKAAIIRPFQTFVIKLSNASSSLNFDNLRRFKYEPRAVGVPYSVVAKTIPNNKISKMEVSTLNKSTSRVSSVNTVKQLGVIALDTNKKEIGRTYYVVYSDAVTGFSEKAVTQVTASSKNVIGTFEETKKGGIDESLTSSYWLYINEANENDFKGKEIPLKLYSNDVKFLKFEVLENATDIKDGQEILSSGESFYIFDGSKHVTVANNKEIIVSAPDANFGVFYGKPTESSAGLKENVNIEKPSATILVYDESIESHKIIFDPEWKTATVQVFDMSGRLLSTQTNIDTSNEFIVSLPKNIRATYIVNAISNTGKKFSQKVIK